MQSSNLPLSTLKKWHAKLDLTFGFDGRRTVPIRRKHEGPLQIQKPFYPEPDGTCHIYILHPPGGVVGGDILNTDIAVEKNAQVLVTTPAATKFYRSDNYGAEQNCHLKIAPGASLEWFPQENIIFDGADVKTTTRVDLSGDCNFIGWEVLCLGRPASGEMFNIGSVRQTFELWCGKSPLWIEHAHIEGGSPVMSSKWGLSDYPVTATFVCVTINLKLNLKDKIRKIINTTEGTALMSVTQLDQVLLCRYLGNHAEEAKSFFVAAWEILRPKIFKKNPCLPRIWET